MRNLGGPATRAQHPTDRTPQRRHVEHPERARRRQTLRGHRAGLGRTRHRLAPLSGRHGSAGPGHTGNAAPPVHRRCLGAAPAHPRRRGNPLRSAQLRHHAPTVHAGTRCLRAEFPRDTPVLAPVGQAGPGSRRPQLLCLHGGAAAGAPLGYCHSVVVSNPGPAARRHRPFAGHSAPAIRSPHLPDRRDHQAQGPHFPQRRTHPAAWRQHHGL